jgi:hypothetical protein
MKTRRFRVTMLAVVVSAIAAPLLDNHSGATASFTDSLPSVAQAINAQARNSIAARPTTLEVAGQTLTDEAQSPAGKISPELIDALGIKRPARGRDANSRIAKSLKDRGNRNGNSRLQPMSGQPLVLNARSALSAALMTTLGGRDNQFSEVALVADWDGREDCVADHSAKVDDFSGVESEVDFTLTRVSISEHTIANGFNENAFYYGDSVGNLWIGTDRGGDGGVDAVQQINTPALVRAAAGATSVDIGGASIPAAGFPAGDCTDDQVTVTGIAVNPVADLGDFGLCGAIGEVVYIATLDTEGCAGNASNQPIRTRIFCLGLADCRTVCGTVTAFTPATPASGGSIVIGGVQTFFIGPGIILRNQGLITVGANICLCSVLTTAGQFAVGGVSLAPVTDTDLVPIGVRQILRDPLSNIAGVAVDDDSNLYFQLVDLINVQNGGAIFKVTETPRVVAGCGPGPRINRVIAAIPNGLTGSIGLVTAVGSTVSPVLTSGGFRLTNYSGQSTTFGNIVSLASGQSNVLYAAVARSFNPADDAATQATEGAFASPAALGPTPSMIISFADCSGGFDSCSSPAPGIPGILPVADGFADVARSGVTRIPGVNNFRIFALGNGPDIRPAIGGTAIVPGTPASVLKLDMQIDFTIHSGIAVNEERTVFVISGGTPAGIGKNPSPMLGEILCFEDRCPVDRRADPIDFRGDVLPNPPRSGGNVGDGDSDRFDHIFHQAPLDQVTLTPAGLAGLARGFLRYTNRLAANPIGPGVTLGVTGGQAVQGDDDSSGPIIFENLDPGHQVAGGDDQNPPFTGDDDDGLANPNTANNPPLSGPFAGGFEFLFGAAGVPGSATSPCVNNVWNAFFLNSNGNITFNGGDMDDTPTVPEFRSGLPKIAPAWADLNPDARSVNPTNFPAQALGFANVNAFITRWLNVPEFSFENCSTNDFGIGGNTFSVTLFDDGNGVDENSNKALEPDDPTGDNVDSAYDLQEGPTDFRFTELVFGHPIGSCTNVGGFCSFGTCRTMGSRKRTCDEACTTCSNVASVGEFDRDDGIGEFLFVYSSMSLLGTEDSPVITGYSIGGGNPLNPPGLCEINLSEAARAADTNRFGVIQGQTASIKPCVIGEGTEPHIFELFNSGRRAAIGSLGEITLAVADFDLRAEGNDSALCTPIRQRDLNRGSIKLLGVTCPITPHLCTLPGSDVVPDTPIAVAPNQPEVGSDAAASRRDAAGNPMATPTSGIINALCAVSLDIVGTGFFPNETTIICQGFNSETGVPLQRPGKTVATTVALACDTNGDGTPDFAFPLDQVTPVNRNLIQARLPVLGPQLPGTAFPLACCGGLADITVTTTFTGGDNNIFGPFTRSATCTIDLGVRAPVVVSATPSSGNCSVPQDLLISGACFVTGQGSVTSVFAVERGNPSNIVRATNFVVLNSNLIDALFNFGSANAGRAFLIFVTGPGGTSRNLTALPEGVPPGCPLGNEQGVQVTFTCNPSILQSDTPVVTACQLERSPSGSFSLVVTGINFQQGATVTVGGKIPKKVRFKDFQVGSNAYHMLVLKGKICSGLSGAVVVTNPGGKASSPFQCGESCKAQN